MFGQSTFGGGGTTGGNTLFGGTQTQANYNPMKDLEINSPPDDSISSLEFSPATVQATFLVAGSWDNNVSKFLVNKNS